MFAHASRGRDDHLALVAVERASPRSDRLVAAAGGFEHLGEVAVRLALPRERIGPRPPGERLFEERDRLVVLPARRADERLRLAPERLRPHVLRVAQLAALLGELLCFIRVAESADDAAEQRRVAG